MFFISKFCFTAYFFSFLLSQKLLPILCHDSSFHKDNIYSVKTDSGRPDLSSVVSFSVNASSVWYCGLVVKVRLITDGTCGFGID